MAVSDAGQVVYSKLRKGARGTFLCFLHIVENGEVRTVIPETTDVLSGMAFLQIAGREQLLMVREPHILLMLPGLQGVERKLLKLKHGTSLCRSGEGKALYVQRTGVEGEWEVRELEFIPSKCYNMKKATLSLGWELVRDICTAGGLLVLCSGIYNSVVGVSLSDWQVKWKMSVVEPTNVCPGTPGSVFVACLVPGTIHQLSLQDGSVLTQLPLVPCVVTPHCVCNRNNILYVAHEDAKIWETKKQRDLKISQYRFK